jgi:hypothetical protein
MVPVPREHVLDVMRFVLDRDLDGAIRRDRERMTKLLGAEGILGPLLQLVAARMVENQPTRVREVADELGVAEQAVIGAVRGVNFDALEGGFDRVLRLREDTFRTADGREWNSLVVTMAPELARMVCDVATTPEQDDPQ